MTFSIIICTYNAEKGIVKTLDSILKQSYHDFEVVIVDGASTDNTISILKKYSKKFDGKLRWISEHDNGIYDAMNKGVQMAEGKFLNVVGAGDWLEKDAFKNAFTCIKNNPDADAVHGKLRIWDENKKNSYLLQTFPENLAVDPIQHPALYYKKALHETYGLYDEKYRIVSDYLFCMKAFLLGVAKAVSFDYVVDNYVTDGISSKNQNLCKLEDMKARNEVGILPLVSIIIPSYNQAPYIKETLDSVLTQVYPNWECIIVDDGSTDKTEEIVKKYLKKDNRFKYIKQVNQGVSVARNKGILSSGGKYILPLDSDDLISKDYTKEAVEVLEKRPDVKLVYCDAEFFGEKNGKWRLPEYSYNDLLFNNMIFCSAMYRRIDYNNTKGYNDNMIDGLEDWDFWLSLLSEDDIVYKIKKVHFYYRIKELSRNNNMLNKNILLEKMYKQIFLNHLNIYIDTLNPLFTRSILNQEIKKKNQELNLIKSSKFWKLRESYMSWKNKTKFTLFCPKKFLRKYF